MTRENLYETINGAISRLAIIQAALEDFNCKKLAAQIEIINDALRNVTNLLSTQD